MRSFSPWVTTGALATAIGTVIVACGPQLPNYSGAELYAANCANCHGIGGDGDGPAVPMLSLAIPDLRGIAARNRGTFPRDEIAELIDGREIKDDAHWQRRMPVWGHEFQRTTGYDAQAERRIQAKIGALIEHLENLQRED